MARQTRGDADTGGQWNFTGVLYQLLVTLRAGLTAVVEQVSAGKDVLSVRIVVEPDLGGDAQTLGAVRRVDQIKIRRGQAPWTTRVIIEDVLPDLFKALDPDGPATQFRFVTDDLEGTAAFTEFAKTVKYLDEGGKLEASLPAEPKSYRWGNERISASTLFDRAAELLDDGQPARVWSLLANVEIAGVAQAVASNDIDTMLLEMVDDPSEVSIKRRALCTDLLGLGTAGAQITVAALLHSVGLDPAKLTHARHLPAQLRAQLEREAVLRRYRSEMDVRAAPTMPNVPLCVFSGHSGQGKTWRLCQAARNSADAGHCAILLAAAGTLHEIEAAIIEACWRSTFGGQPSLTRVAQMLAPKLGDAEGQWLTVYLDDLADPELGLALARLPWATLGIRVVVTAQDRITQMLVQAVESLAEIPVPDFTLPELRTYLIRAGRDPHLVPDDVLLSLLRPILASIYCRIPGSERWAAVTEYQLIDEYWRWATTAHRVQSLHRGDGAAVLALAGTLLDGPAIYPWTPTVLRKHGVDADTRHRLITNGVLREEESGAIQMAHSRLLNWVVAEEIARRFVEGERDLEGVTDQLNALDAIITPQDDRIGRRLGYVLHDLFWMLARRSKPDKVGALALLCVRAGVASADHEHFFTDGLGSLGEPILPVLAWMARQPFPDDEWQRPRHIGAALRVLGTASSDAVATVALDLVEADIEHSRSIGLRVLRTVPGKAGLELLWTINHARGAALEAAKGNSDDWGERRSEKDASFSALARAVSADPHWIVSMAARAKEAQDAEQLMWLLIGLDLRVSRPIWTATKARLLDMASADGTAAPRAIRHFLDQDEIERVERHLVEPAPATAALWFDALARLAPDKAVAALGGLGSRSLWGTTHWWLPGLIHRTGNRVRTEVLRTIGVERSQDDPILAELALLFGGETDLLDVETFDRLLDNYEACLEADAVHPSEKTRYHLRKLIASVSSPVLLERLSARAGTRFEALVTQASSVREGRTSMLRDTDGDEYRQILGAIGGNGYDELILAELDRPDVHGRTDGVTAALFTRNAAIRAKLEAIAHDPDDDTYRGVMLMHSLAAHHADAGLEAMVRHGSPVYLRAVDIRDGGPSWSDDAVARVRALLAHPDAAERLIGINLCGFLRAETGGGLLAPLMVDPAASDDEIGLAVGVLSQLGYYQPAFLPRLRPRLTRSEKGRFAGNYLAWQGDADARAAVGDYLDAHPLKELSSSEIPIAFRLLQHEDSAAVGRRFLKRVWERGFAVGNEGSILAALADAGDNEAAGALQKIAYQKPRRGNASVAAAIQALRRSDPAEAKAAAERFFRRTLDADAAALLLIIDPNDGTHLVLREYQRASVHSQEAFGRLLRTRAPRPLYLDTLDALSRSLDQKDRLMAAELAGWLPAEEAFAGLDRLADDDSYEVEMAALSSLRRRTADAGAATLISTIPDQPKPRQWAWLKALILLCDPELLQNPMDPRSIAGLLESIGGDFSEECRRLLEARSKTVRQQAERAQKDRDRA